MLSRLAHSSVRTRSVLTEWCVLVAFLLGLTWAAQQQAWLGRIDHTLYDSAMSLWQRAPSDNIVIVAVDEDSLAQIGRWPWRRAIHAAILDKLTQAGVRAVGMDVIFSEPDTHDPLGDAALEVAIRRNGHVVLPVLAERLNGDMSETLPLPALINVAAAIGHIQLELDNDGVARSLFLKEGLGDPRYPHFAAALLGVARHSKPLLPGVRRQKEGVQATENAWQRDYWFHIPFAGPPNTFKHVSVAALLRGDVPDYLLRDKLVLVGATAAGLGDAYSTPVSGLTRSMAGVEISANVVDALQRNIDIHFPDADLIALYNTLPWLLAMVAFLFWTPRHSLQLTLGLSIGLGLMSLLGLRFGQVWLAPSVPLMGLLLCYPLWSWRRLEASMRYMAEEVATLTQEAARFPGALPAQDALPRITVDKVEARIAEVQRATKRMAALRLFVEDALRNQSDGLVVVDAQGTVLLANPNAADYLGVASPALMRNKSLLDSLAHWPCNDEQGWLHWLQQARAGRSVQCETQSADGRDFLISTVVTHTENAHELGWVLNITNITQLKEADRQRQELLNFLSHDMRAPQASILALLSQRPGDELLDKIAGYAERTLHLASQFMQLARAESLHGQHKQQVDIVAVMHDAIDEMWPLAEARHIRIERKILTAEALLLGDPSLLCRALVNLLSNAIKHSPVGGVVECSVVQQGSMVCCAIRDQGVGIAREDLPRLFRRFSRLENAQDGVGAGLGLALVKMVAEKHGGSASVNSVLGQGSCFNVFLPVLSEAM